MTSIEMAKGIRKTTLRMVHSARASHIGGVLSISDIVAVLFSQVLNLKPNDPEWTNRDRFILSKGHCCAGVYAGLSALGYFPAEDLQHYASNYSKLMSHISHKVAGVEFSTGSLGHGLPFGVGKSLAAKRKAKDWRTFVLMSDGELDEGSNWEAMLFAAHHQLDNLVAIVDYNKLQSLTTVDKTLGLEPLANKFRAFGWSVREVDGHDHAALARDLGSVPWTPGKPSIMIAHTIKGKGISFMENKVEWHYRSPNDKELTQALAELEA